MDTSWSQGKEGKNYDFLNVDRKAILEDAPVAQEDRAAVS